MERQCPQIAVIWKGKDEEVQTRTRHTGPSARWPGTEPLGQRSWAQKEAAERSGRDVLTERYLCLLGDQRLEEDHLEASRALHHHGRPICADVAEQRGGGTSCFHFNSSY